MTSKGWICNMAAVWHVREISLHVQQHQCVDVGLVFSVKINPCLKIKYTFEIFHQPAVKL